MLFYLIYQIRRLDLRVYFIIKEKGGTCLTEEFQIRYVDIPLQAVGLAHPPALAPLETEQEFVLSVPSRPGALRGKPSTYRGGT